MGGVYPSRDGHFLWSFCSDWSSALTQQLLSWWLGGVSSPVVILCLLVLGVTQRLHILCASCCGVLCFNQPNSYFSKEWLNHSLKFDIRNEVTGTIVWWSNYVKASKHLRYYVSMKLGLWCWAKVEKPFGTFLDDTASLFILGCPYAIFVMYCYMTNCPQI